MGLTLDQALKLAKKKARDGSNKEAELIYRKILSKLPKNKKAINGVRALSSKVTQKSLSSRNPHKVQMQELLNLHSKGQFHKALLKASQLLLEFPNSPDLYNFHGSSSAKYLFPNLDKSIKRLTACLNLKLSKDSEINFGYS